MNFAFFGTDEFSVGVLESLKERGFLPSLVVTMPDRPKGRKMILTPPPAKIWAEENSIAVIQPESLKTIPPEFIGSDLFIVASYGKIIPQTILDLSKHGTLNVHPSLLPKYRGATPLEATILNGDTETGVTILLVDAEMDHGPILAVEKFVLTGEEYYEELRDRTAKIGGEMLAKIIPDWLEGKITPEEQDHAQTTFTKKITKEDGLINLEDLAEINYRKVRAFTPWPGTYFFANKDSEQLRVVIKKARLENGQLIIDRVVPEGRAEMNWLDFERG